MSQHTEQGRSAPAGSTPASLATSPSSSRRFWVTVAAFAVANVAAWVGMQSGLLRWPMPAGAVASSASSAAPLKVVQFTPGDNSVAVTDAVFAWKFDADVAVPGPCAQPPVVINPAVPGKWTWTDARTLSFSPEGELPRATALTFTLPPGAVRAVGSPDRTLTTPFVATVRSRPLALTAVRHVGRVEGQPILELSFSDAVSPADVAKFVRLADAEQPDGIKLPDRSFEPFGQAAGKKIRIRCVAPIDDSLPPNPGNLIVTARQGLPTSAGPLGLTADASFPVTISNELLLTESNGYTPAGQDPRVILRFNGEADVEKISRVLSIEPAIPFRVYREWDHAVRIAASFTPGERYVIKLNAPPAGSASGFPKPTTVGVYIEDRPSAVWFDAESGYLGSNGNRTVLAKAVNVPAIRVGVLRVYDNQLVAWRNTDRNRRRYYESDRSLNFARPVVSKRIELTGKKNMVQDVRIALDDLLPKDQQGDGVYRITISSEDGKASNRPPMTFGHEDDKPFDYFDGNSATLVTLSDIGLTARRGVDGLHAWATSLSTAKPLAGVRVRVYSDKNQLLGTGMTNADGLAHLANIRPATGESPVVVLADDPSNRSTDADAATVAAKGLTWLDLRTADTSRNDAETGGRAYLRDGYEAFLYADRGVYRPGETVYLRAIVRGADQAVPPSFPVKWTLRRPDLRDWNTQIMPLDADGAAGLTITLPSDLPTGRWTAQIGMPGDSQSGRGAFGTMTFLVEDFMPERIKAGVSFSPAGRLQQKDKPKVRLQADYLFGKPAADLAATMAIRLEPIAFEHAKWKGWTFGDAGRSARPDSPVVINARRFDLPPMNTGENGLASWNLPLDEQLPADVAASHFGPWRVTAAGGVSERGGRTVSVNAVAELDMAKAYLAVRPIDASPQAGSAAQFELALVSPDGSPADSSAALSAQLFRETWNNTLVREEGRYRYKTTRLLEPVGGARNLALSAGRGMAEVTAPTGGAYVLQVRGTKLPAMVSIPFIATQSHWQDNISRQDPEKVELRFLPAVPAFPAAAVEGALNGGDPAGALKLALAGATDWITASMDRSQPAPAKFAVGASPRLLIRSPFAGKLLLTIETDRVVERRVIDMPASQMVVPINVSAACRPNAYVTATVVREVNPELAWRAHRASGVLRLPVDPADRRLAVRLDAPSEIRPESVLAGSVKLTLPDGSPAAGAAVTIAAVDEGILQLTNFATPDPLGFFSAVRALGVKSADVFGLLMPEVPKGEKHVGGDGEGDADGGRHSTPVVARRVKSVALFSGVLHADASGVAGFELPVGQFAGKLRLMAVAYTGSAAATTATGSAAASTLVRSPVMVQSSWPRFAAPTDRFAVPVTLFNNTAMAGAASLRVSLAGQNGASPIRVMVDGKEAADHTLADIQIPAGGEKTVYLQAVATRQVGVAMIQLQADMGAERFTESLELPVRPAAPETTEGGFVVATAAAPARIQPPAEILDGTRQLQIRVSNRPTLNLPRGLQYLDRYPYGCAEQTISGAMPLVALGDVGEQLAPGMFDRQRVAMKLQSAILRLSGMQTADGGLAMWGGSTQAWPWASVYAAHLLVEAQAAGHEVPDEFRDRLLGYCRALLDESSDSPERIESQAYACYVLAIAGKAPRATMSRLQELLNRPAAEADAEWQRLGSSTARSHLAMAFLASGRRDLAADLLPKIWPAQNTPRQLAGNVGSPIRDKAVYLSALLQLDPEKPEVAALAQQIADAGARGEWRSTQETAMALCALGRYMRSVKAAAPYESAELWAGGRMVARADAGAPLSWDLPKGETAPTDIEVRISGEPTAKAFVSWIQHGVPTGAVEAVDAGMKIRRRYLDRDGQPIDQAKVRTGDLVQVELAISGGGAMQNIVIDDLLPAGLEIENANLASGRAAIEAQADRRRGNARQANAFSSTFVGPRDDRMIVVGHLNSAGVGTVRYLARAVTPGDYILPPVKAECMYDIGIHSISSGGTMNISSGQR